MHAAHDLAADTEIIHVGFGRYSRLSLSVIINEPHITADFSGIRIGKIAMQQVVEHDTDRQPRAGFAEQALAAAEFLPAEAFPADVHGEWLPEGRFVGMHSRYA